MDDRGKNPYHTGYTQMLMILITEDTSWLYKQTLLSVISLNDKAFLYQGKACSFRNAE